MTEPKNPSSSGGASGRVLSTAQHALQALEIIAQHPKGIPIKALARRLNISLSSGYYLISSMREQGFAEVSPSGPGLYTLGPKFAELYVGYVAASLQPERLTPVLDELRDRASARAYSAMWNDGDLEVVQIRGRRGSRELQDVTKGFRGAAHGLALGKIYLAHLPEEEWPASLNAPTYKRYTPATITSPTWCWSARTTSPTTSRSSRPAPAASPRRSATAATGWWRPSASRCPPGASRPSRSSS
jgi:DNA-binding IclR family transcriptional regulator